MSTPIAPDPNTVSHEAVARIAQQRAGTLFNDVIVRDAKIQELQQYIAQLEAALADRKDPVTEAAEWAAPTGTVD